MRATGFRFNRFGVGLCLVAWIGCLGAMTPSVMAAESDDGASAPALAEIPAEAESNRLLEKWLVSDAKLEGNWQGFFLFGFDNSRVVIRPLEEKPGSYRVEFRRFADFGECTLTTTGRYEKGVLFLDDAISGFGGTPIGAKYRQIYTIRPFRRDLLLPSVNVKGLADPTERAKSGFVYQKIND